MRLESRSSLGPSSVPPPFSFACPRAKGPVGWIFFFLKKKKTPRNKYIALGGGGFILASNPHRESNPVVFWQKVFMRTQIVGV